MMKNRILTDYQFLKNEKGQLLLILSLPDSFPDHPRFFYDGGAHALFCRTPQDVYVIADLPAEITPYLAFHDTINIVERQENAQQGYQAQCLFSHDIPALSALR
ncbi:MAG: hypothetical protein U1E36_09710 [Rickettsiales bacterium]